ncbi:MAG: glucoamylase family protein, partial [Betaproteobacteria bacterium]
VSESGYNAFDVAMNYQYRAFGVPGLGLKRGLADDLVIAPYATVLALMVAPEAACQNMERLSQAGMEGRYGFYEAADYTPSRLARGQTSVIIRSFMAHHQGMNLLALVYQLRDRPMQRRFESDPEFEATMPLLHERIPQSAARFQPPPMLSDVQATSSGAEMPVRILTTADTPAPEVQLLSNGRYHVMVTNAGGGYSRWRDLAVTRWREDVTSDNWGSFCFIRDVASGTFWSYAHQPTAKPAARYEAIFSEARIEFRRHDLVEGGAYETHAEIVVSPEDDIELRRVRVTNRSRVRKTIDVTSYAEVVLATPAADAAHPAFSKLFVQTEIVARHHAIVCTRRPRSKDEQQPWMFHQVVAHGAEIGHVSYETDRARFIGRGSAIADPQAMRESGALSGSEGSVLDPVVAIRHRLSLEPGQTVTIDVVSGVAETRDTALSLVGKYQDRHLADRVFDLAWTHSLVALRQINASESDAQLYGRLASSVIYANVAMRASAAVIARNRRGQSGLWSYAISGDLPIVLLQIGDAENIDLVRQLVRAHAYWRLKGLAVDLVIWNEDRAGYRQQLQEQIMGLIAAGAEAHLMDRPGGIFVRRAEQIADEDRVLLQTVARAIISDRRGSLAEQVTRRGLTEARTLQLNVLRPRTPRATRAEAEDARRSTGRDLQFFNGCGGFSADGREYVIRLAPGQVTPLPWVNVLANQQLGTVISESGQGYTWTENAHEFRLTPWGNDPVSDTSGEAFYIRDEESGRYWSPTPLPCRGTTGYVTRHGFGYSIFEHDEDEITSELTVYVDLDVPVRYAVLKVRNESERERRLSVADYVEWTLGDQQPAARMHMITEIDPGSGALCARNAYNIEFPGRLAFLDVDEVTRTQTVTMTGDRTEFLGRNGTLRRPAAMRRAQLSNRVGPALDPCGAIQVAFTLGPGQEREMVFRLGAGIDAEEAGKLMHRFRGSAAAKSALEKVRDYWRRTLGTVQVKTPDPALDILANGWLVYQTLACRVWARSGYYQSGGAYGFRDQLQDLMALIYAEPRLTREHLLRSAAHQFREGDVQHWWHPPVGRGVRTNCSDDFLWLPLATARYVEATGDTGVLLESIGYLEGRPVPFKEDSYYDLPGRSDLRGTLYEHCVAALLHGLRFGERGLPLMGSGDWNDGMNLVGIGGKGESVWLGFFLCEVLNRFAVVARLQNDHALVERCHTEVAQLRRNIEAHAWDGKWYRRAWFDNGTPLGAAANEECQIDSIAQSWSVLTGIGDPLHARMAMEAVDERLVNRRDRLVKLLTPPFNHSNLDPGYIKGYVPGVRENGGQYTHAAIWTAMAFAALGDSRRAWELVALINPLTHSGTPADIATYKVEPYVIAADVYAVAPHTGRGGWTWYTGSAGWMYRLVVESLLGLSLQVDKLRFAPCLPEDWPGFSIAYRYRETTYRITVTQGVEGSGPMRVFVDGVLQPGGAIPLVDDRKEHQADIHIAAPAPAPARDIAPLAGELA